MASCAWSLLGLAGLWFSLFWWLLNMLVDATSLLSLSFCSPWLGSESLSYLCSLQSESPESESDRRTDSVEAMDGGAGG